MAAAGGSKATRPTSCPPSGLTIRLAGCARAAARRRVGVRVPNGRPGPLPQWTFSVSPCSGSPPARWSPGLNGAAQAILDAHALRVALESTTEQQQALLAYEADRLPKDIGGRPPNRTDPSRCHPARDLGTDRRPSLRRHRRCDFAGGTGADLAELPEDRRFRGAGRASSAASWSAQVQPAPGQPPPGVRRPSS